MPRIAPARLLPIISPMPSRPAPEKPTNSLLQQRVPHSVQLYQSRCQKATGNRIAAIGSMALGRNAPRIRGPAHCRSRKCAVFFQSKVNDPSTALLQQIGSVRPRKRLSLSLMPDPIEERRRPAVGYPDDRKAPLRFPELLKRSIITMSSFFKSSPKCRP